MMYIYSSISCIHINETIQFKQKNTVLILYNFMVNYLRMAMHFVRNFLSKVPSLEHLLPENEDTCKDLGNIFKKKILAQPIKLENLSTENIFKKHHNKMNRF